MLTSKRWTLQKGLAKGSAISCFDVNEKQNIITIVWGQVYGNCWNLYKPKDKYYMCEENSLLLSSLSELCTAQLRAVGLNML